MATARVEYVPDRRGTAVFARGPQVQALTTAGAQAGKAYAETVAPVDTGEYARSFRVEQAQVTVGGERRAGAQLVNTAPHAVFVEHRNRAAVLQRAGAFIEQTFRSRSGGVL